MCIVTCFVAQDSHPTYTHIIIRCLAASSSPPLLLLFLQYVFGNYLNPVSKNDHTVSGFWQAYFTNFAKTGSPNADGVPTPWPKYERATDKHLAINNPPVPGAGLKGPICDFWDTLPRQGKYNH